MSDMALGIQNAGARALAASQPQAGVAPVMAPPGNVPVGGNSVSMPQSSIAAGQQARNQFQAAPQYGIGAETGGTRPTPSTRGPALGGQTENYASPIAASNGMGYGR